MRSRRMTWFVLFQFIALAVEANRGYMLSSHLSRRRESQDYSRDPPVEAESPVTPQSLHDNSRGPLRERVIISGIAKDVPPEMTRTLIPQLIQLGEAFEDYHIVVYENNSPPDSREAFKQELAKTRHSTFLYQDNVVRLGSRTDVIARARNMLIQYIYSHFNESYDFVIVADLDGACPQSFNIPAFKRLLSRSDEWDVVSFNNVPYWDLWAFRDKDHMPYNHWSGQAMHNTIHNSHDMDAWLGSLPPDELAPIESAFMMLTMYKMSTFEGTKYSGQDPNGEMDCEHVAFHRDIIQRHNGRIRITTYNRCVV